MNITQRKVGRYPGQCETPGCNRSARYEARFLGDAYKVGLCSHCKRDYEEAYDNALSNWGQDAHDIAEQYRAQAVV